MKNPELEGLLNNIIDEISTAELVLKDQITKKVIKVNGIDDILSFSRENKKNWENFNKDNYLSKIFKDGFLLIEYNILSSLNSPSKNTSKFITNNFDGLKTLEPFRYFQRHFVEYNDANLSLIKNLLEYKQPNVFIGFFAYLNKQKINIDDHWFSIGYLLAFNFENPVTNENHRLNFEKLDFGSMKTQITGLIKTIEKKDSEIASIKAKYQQILDEQRKDLDAKGLEILNSNKLSIDKFEEEKTGFFKSQEIEFKKLHDAYSDDMKLKGPVKYWNDRAKTYKDNGRNWMYGFIGSVVLSTGILLTILICDFPFLKLNILTGEPGSIKATILLATIVSIMIYLVRLTSKMTFSSFHMQRDAEEKEQLTLVYLALIKEGASISDNDRQTILQALFARVETGLLHHDSSPTMPGLGSVADQFTSSKRN